MPTGSIYTPPPNLNPPLSGVPVQGASLASYSMPPIGSAASVNTLGIPGFSGLSAQASQRISDLMAGKIPSDVQSQIQQGRAQQAVASGMPGTGATQGTLQGNATLRDLGLTSLQAGQQGFQDLLSMLGSYAGNVFPTAGQSLQSQTSLQEAGMQAASEAARLAEQAREYGGNLGFNYAQLGQQGQYQMGQLGLQNQAQQFQNQQFQQNLQQQANQYQQNFGLQEQQLAQQLGISQSQLAYQMAALNAQQQNQAAQNALSLAQLNAQTGYNTRAQDLQQLQTLYGLLGQGGGTLTNLQQLLALLGPGGGSIPFSQLSPGQRARITTPH